jgi:hypothetical protein
MFDQPLCHARDTVLRRTDQRRAGSAPQVDIHAVFVERLR